MRKRLRLRTTLAIAIALVPLGYLSAMISRAPCENHAARQIAVRLGPSTVFTYEGDAGSTGYPGSEVILRRTGFRTRPCSRTEPERMGRCFPVAGVAWARVRYPYLV